MTFIFTTQPLEFHVVLLEVSPVKPVGLVGQLGVLAISVAISGLRGLDVGDGPRRVKVGDAQNSKGMKEL